MGNDKLLLGCFYRSPNGNDEQNSKLNNEIIRGVRGYSHILITGDFNHPEIDWKNCVSSKDQHHKSSTFLENIRDCYLEQHVTEPTHHRGDQQANTLDLIFTNEEDMIDKVDLISPLGKRRSSQWIKFYLSRPKLNYNIGDYNQVRQDLQEIDWHSKLENTDVHTAFNTICEDILQVTRRHIPVKKTINKANRTRPLWMSTVAMDKVKVKNKLYRKFIGSLRVHGNTCSTRSNNTFYLDYVRARNQAKWEIRKAKRDYERDVAMKAKINPKAFYKYANSKTRSGIGNLIKPNGTLTVDDREKAEALNSFFTSVFTQEDLINIPDFGSTETLTRYLIQ